MGGRVQGVFFRDFVRREARRLGLVGWVRNEPDGSLALVAEGPREALEELLQAVRRGPPAAQVGEVETHWGGARDRFGDFRVRY